MTNFIVKLEDMLLTSGKDNWEIMYIPEHNGYLLKIDEDVIFMTKINEED